MTITAPDTKEIATRGTEIYDRRYRSQYEPKWFGRFAAIGIDSEQAFVEDFPEQALASARRAAPDESFFLVRIGSEAAFKMSRRMSSNAGAR